MSAEVLSLIISLCSVWGDKPPYKHLDQVCVNHMVTYAPTTQKETLREWRNYKLTPPLPVGKEGE